MYVNALLLIASGLGMLAFGPFGPAVAFSLLGLGHLILLWCCIAPMVGRG